MKARLENNEIKVYSSIPNSFQAGDILVAGGGKNLSDEILKSYGFYDLARPDYDHRIQELANLHLEGDVYTYDVIDKPIQGTLAELKADKIAQLKRMVGSKLSVTDWYIIREADSGEATPDSIRGERAALRTKSDSIEAEINALTTKKSVVLFEINL